jgi:hypothetical protein
MWFNFMIINEYLIGNYMEGSGLGLHSGIIPTLACRE